MIVYLHRMKMPELLPGTLSLATPLFALGSPPARTASEASLSVQPSASRGDQEAGPTSSRACTSRAYRARCGASRSPARSSVMVFYPVGGGSWRLGARYLLPMMPLFVIASLVIARRSRLFLGVAIATGLLGLVPQYFNHQLQGEIAAATPRSSRTSRGCRSATCSPTRSGASRSSRRSTRTR